VQLFYFTNWLLVRLLKIIQECR